MSNRAALRHLQTDPAHRRRGVGAALVHAAHAVARDEMDLDHLRLAVRDGEGLETFYRRLGWETVGRWPRALRMPDGALRDEVLMRIALAG